MSLALKDAFSLESYSIRRIGIMCDDRDRIYFTESNEGERKRLIETSRPEGGQVFYYGSWCKIGACGRGFYFTGSTWRLSSRSPVKINKAILAYQDGKYINERSKV